MEKTNHILETLNAIGPAWADQFETKPEINLMFQVTEDGTLTLNGHAVCSVAAIIPSSVYIAVEHFGFFTQTGEEYRFHVNWPFEGAPCVERFSHIKVTEHTLSSVAV